jgi:hypothetical protein
MDEASQADKLAGYQADIRRKPQKQKTVISDA